MVDNVKHVMDGLRRVSSRYDTAGEQMADFLRRQTEGEKPDPNQFIALLKHQSTNKDVLTAQFKLYEKPLKTVLNETK